MNGCVAACKKVNGFQASFGEFVLWTPFIQTSHIRLIQLSFLVTSLQLIVFFLFQLAMKHKCWDTAQSWNLLKRSWKGYNQQLLQEIQSSVCFSLPVQWRCILSVSVQENVLHFYFSDLLLFLFFNIATQSCGTFYLYFSCYRSESKYWKRTKWQADQD